MRRDARPSPYGFFTVAIAAYAFGSSSKRFASATIVAPLMFRSFDDADVDGFTASGVNIVYGHQRGLAIALVNYAESMNGLQLGAINIIRDNPAGRRVLPVLNWGR